jgi:hypothetical protein
MRSWPQCTAQAPRTSAAITIAAPRTSMVHPPHTARVIRPPPRSSGEPIRSDRAPEGQDQPASDPGVGCGCRVRNCSASYPPPIPAARVGDKVGDYTVEQQRSIRGVRDPVEPEAEPGDRAADEGYRPT